MSSKLSVLNYYKYIKKRLIKTQKMAINYTDIH